MTEETKENQSFWRRQFSETATSNQQTFDVVVGIGLPILCFIFDPIVFRNNMGIGIGLELTPYKFLVYFFSGIAIVALSVWLIAGNRSSTFSSVIAGVLLLGSVCSLVIGILILPLSLFGLLLLIGVLGFIPFLTSFVYLRNGMRALNSAKASSSQARVTALVLLGVCLIIGPPLLGDWQINRMITQSMNDLYSGDVQAAETAARKLRYFGWAVDSDRLVWTYSKETKQPRKEALARAYKEITGEDIEARLRYLLD